MCSSDLTGLTRVMHDIMRRLADRHEIHYLGIGYSGEIVVDRGLTIYPTNPKGGDVFAAFQAERMIKEIDPDLVFILHDIWCFEHYLKILSPYRDRLKIIGYIPLDGEIVRLQPAPGCVTVNICPPMLTTPVRDDAPLFAVTVKLSVPFPLPFAVPVSSTQAALDTAVQLQRVVTFTAPVPPFEGTAKLVESSVMVQELPLCVRLKI